MVNKDYQIQAKGQRIQTYSVMAASRVDGELKRIAVEMLARADSVFVVKTQTLVILQT